MPAPRRRGRGYIETLPSGSYRAVMPAGVDPLTGRRRALRETTLTLPEAEKALTRLQKQVDEQQHPKSAITVREAVEQWREVADLGVATREQYDDVMRLYIDPTLGKMQTGRLNAELLERFYGRLLRCKHLCSARPPKGHQCKPLGPSSVRKVHYILRAALDRAVRWRYLAVNPAELVSAPSPSASNPDPPTDKDADRPAERSLHDAGDLGGTWRTASGRRPRERAGCLGMVLSHELVSPRLPGLVLLLGERLPLRVVQVDAVAGNVPGIRRRASLLKGDARDGEGTSRSDPQAASRSVWASVSRSSLFRPWAYTLTVYLPSSSYLMTEFQTRPISRACRPSVGRSRRPPAVRLP